MKIHKYTIFGTRVYEYIKTTNYENTEATKNSHSNPKKYTIKDLAEYADIDAGNLSKYLKGEKTTPLKNVIKIIIVLGCDEATALSFIREAGYDITGHTMPFCEEYMTIIENMQSSEWFESNDAKDIMGKAGVIVEKRFKHYKSHGKV